MWIRHKGTGKEVFLGKYYPSTGWGMWAMPETLDAFFSETSDGSQWGNTDYVIVTETDEPDDLSVAKRAATEAIAEKLK